MKGNDVGGERGTTFVEMLLALAVFAILTAAMSQVMKIMRSVEAENSIEAKLHAHALRAMRTIVKDLKRSEFRAVGGKDFPYVFDDGVASWPFTSHAHTPASSSAVSGEPEFGPNREIVFVLPADADNDGRPDLTANAVDWSPAEISYTLVTGTAGNELVRSVGAQSYPIARNVERLVFDTPLSSGFAIPLGTVRVQLFLRARDRHGTVYRHQSETTVRLQFGDA